MRSPSSNQVDLDCRGLEKLTVRGGIHEITLGYQRFASNIGRRQNRQSFGATAAFYDADDWASDTDKFGLYTEWGF